MPDFETDNMDMEFSDPRKAQPTERKGPIEAINADFAVSRVEPAKPTAPNSPQPTQPTAPEYDSDAVTDRVGESIQKLFGRSPEQIKEDLAFAAQARSVQAAQQAALTEGKKFRDAHPEFNASQKNCDIVGALVDGAGLPYTAENFERAYLHAKEHGLLEADVPQPVRLPQNIPPFNPPNQPQALIQADIDAVFDDPNLDLSAKRAKVSQMLAAERNRQAINPPSNPAPKPQATTTGISDSAGVNFDPSYAGYPSTDADRKLEAELAGLPLEQARERMAQLMYAEAQKRKQPAY